MEAPPFAGRPTNRSPFEGTGGHLKFGFAHLAGFLLPAFAIAFELITRMCAEVLFDPLPSLWHLAVVTAVPLINLKLLLMRDREQPVSRGWLFSGAAAAAVGLSYALLFLPVYPFAVIGIIVYGLGLLAFAPLSAGLTAWFVTVRVARNAQRPYLRLMICGLLAGFVLVLALDAPTAITRAAVRGSVDADPAVRARSVKLMRNFGNRELLLRLCYDSSGHTGGLLGLLVEGTLSLRLDEFDQRRANVNPGAARELYYRINGVPYNTVAPPFRGRGWRFADDFAWDPDQGGTVIGGRVSGLSLHSSRIDGSMDADDAVSYVEWITEFTNTSAEQREARMTLVLPPDGAVSRATLWVNGEEREAAFATRAAARAAYQAVVVRQRDPLLVTTNGADQVFVQMFPVPPGGTAKFRIGITAPLALSNDGRATLALPAIVDRNFSIDAALRHAVWIEGEGSNVSADSEFKAIAGENGVVRRRGNFTDQDLTMRRPRISIARNPKAEEIASGTVMQTIRRVPHEPARSFYVVLDGSLRAKPARSALLGALERIPVGARFGFAVASATPGILPLAPWSATRKQELTALLERQSFDGGEDNLGMLAEGIAALQGEPGATLLWIHGPQGFEFDNFTGQLEQVLDRGTHLPEIWLLPVAPGPNKALQHPRVFQLAHTLAWSGDPQADVAAAFTNYFDTAPRWTVRRTPGPPPDLIVGSQHIEKLWALEQIESLMTQGGEGATRAMTLATQHRLVTPVSGAVVLETDVEYTRAGLTPPDAAAVPTIPEPSTWVLLIVAALAFAWAVRQQRRRAFA
jgi:hypothetical protein